MTLLAAEPDITRFTSLLQDLQDVQTVSYLCNVTGRTRNTGMCSIVESAQVIVVQGYRDA